MPCTSESAAELRHIGHTVVPLADAYAARLERLQQRMMSGLLPRRERLAAAARALETTRATLVRSREEIERETSSDAEGVLERLRAAEAHKLAELEGYLVELVAGYSVNNFSCYVFHFHIPIIIAHNKISQVLRFLSTLYDRSRAVL